MQAVAFYLFYPIIWIISRLPFRLAYVLSDFVFLILYYVVGYRKEVIKKNLKIAFPNKSDAERKELAKKSTQHFCDIFIEMVKSMGMSTESMRSRFTCDDIEEPNAYAIAGKPIIVMFGHQASYEWTMVLQERLASMVYAVYKPLKNKQFDNLIRSIRKKFGSEMVAMNGAAKLLKTDLGKRTPLIAMVADQSPAGYRAQSFTKFFNKSSAVFRGSEKMAADYALPVFYLKVSKVKRGYYHAEFIKICDDGSQVPEWYVTDTFFSLLEAQIKEQPEYYLWSHKRWKITPETATRAVELSPLIR
ncbi:MAG: lysophospholipid acyltransferase family protein [Nonlabens sp.]|nr:lysophospholipid acyltransferase family protein [Nonlabens sp.]